MKPYPHAYEVSAIGSAAGPVRLESPGLPGLESAPPLQFDGPGDQWSPETLLCAAVADCFVLTFRAIARASSFPYSDLQVRVEGVLDREGGAARFTVFRTAARLAVPEGTDAARAKTLLEKAERGCLVANSLAGRRELATEVILTG
jgi:organic hydroperoxide reductase OsmC/OhrA